LIEAVWDAGGVHSIIQADAASRRGLIQALEHQMSERDKEIQWYSATVNAWYGTRLEHDRSLLTLSAGAIGLLITLLSTVGVSSVESALLYGAAIFSFLISLASVLWVFRRNGTHLTEILRSNAAGDAVLRTLDAVAIGSFFFGVVLASIIGISAAVHSLQPSEVSMSGEQKTQGQSQDLNESFNGATSMRPTQGDLKKSFDGAMALRPAPATSPAQETSAPAPAPDAPAQPNIGDSK
ncbi:hypothetical protein, partial [Denitratimonas tolerans]